MKKWGLEVEKDKSLQETLLKLHEFYSVQEIMEWPNKTSSHLQNRLDECNGDLLCTLHNMTRNRNI